MKKEWKHETTPMNKKWMRKNREINVRVDARGRDEIIWRNG
jgi:hypothetical protein